MFVLTGSGLELQGGGDGRRTHQSVGAISHHTKSQLGSFTGTHSLSLLPLLFSLFFYHLIIADRPVTF